MKKTASDYASGSNRNRIARCAEAGLSKAEAYSHLRPMVLAQTLVFKMNIGGGRVAKPMQDQLVELRHEIGRVYKLMHLAVTADFDSEEISAEVIPMDDDSESTEDETESDSIEIEEEEEIAVKPTAKGKPGVREQLQYFMRRMREIRAKLATRAMQGEQLDDLGMRPDVTAIKLIPVGIPADALLFAMVAHWPQDARNEFGIADFDYVSLSQSIMRERGIDPTGRHPMFGYVLTLCEERIPVYLHGPMGTGKSTLCRQIADYLELPYGETAMSAGASRGDLYGRPSLEQVWYEEYRQFGNKGFVLSKFFEIGANGGVFNFEEIDAALPEVLIALNNALAGSDVLFNSANGVDYPRSADFVPMATGNTLMMGVNRFYVGRERLDAATIDRWRMGRCPILFDSTLTDSLYESFGV